MENSAFPEATAAAAGRLVAPTGDAAADFDEALDELTGYFFGEFPEWVTYYGAPEDLVAESARRLDDRSVAAEAARRHGMEAQLARLAAIDRTRLDRRRRIIRDSIVTTLDGALEPARVAGYGQIFGEGAWFLPYVVNHNSGALTSVPALLDAQHDVQSAADADAYVARLEAMGPVMDALLDKMRADVAAGAIPPDFIIERTRSVVGGFVAVPPDDSILFASFAEKLRAADIADAAGFEARARDAIERIVYPAYTRIDAQLAAIAPQAPSAAGIWRLPDGPALYRAMIRHMTDTDLTPEQIHRLGQDEVARITGEMDVILTRQGYRDGTVGSRMAALGEDPRFRYPNTSAGRAALLADVRSQLEAVTAVLPDWFGLLPKHEVEVRPVPAFSEETAAGGYYDSPAPDGSRPGIYWINLRDTAMWPKYMLPTLTYHEAIPGHHMQSAVALDRGTVLIGHALYSNASGEGWGLYAEYLAAEMGLYADDPYGDLGRLRDELYRAIRLVVDTGMHALRWTRDEAITYLAEHSGGEMSEVVSEIERYAVWPGQALGYKIGMLKILELREVAATAFGADFDTREFHDRVLTVSTSPLPVIEAEIRAWIRGHARST